MRLARRRTGSSMLEFTFVGIPLLFVLISIFEVSRGLWMWNSLGHGAKEATRFAIVHGNNCSIPPNNCVKTAAQVCQVLRDNAVGVDPNQVVAVTLTFGGPDAPPSFGPGPLNDCLQGNTPFNVTFPSKPWGSTVANPAGAQGQPISIRAVYRFDSALAFYWTGSRGFTFGRIFLPAVAVDRIQY